MTVPTGRLQFFTLEAGDYLDRLADLARRPTAPDSDELVRLTRALRGSALMAGLTAFSQAASGLEQVAKAFREGQWRWGPAEAERIANAVAQMKGLVGRAGEWTDTDSAAATALGRELVEALAGTIPVARPGRPQLGPVDQLPPSVRNFIAREGALVAGSLEHAAQGVDLGPLDQAAELVLRRLQPLRGLGSLPDLAPLPDFLDAVELALRVAREQAPPPGTARALRNLATAIGRLAREVADQGRANPDSPEVAAAAAQLLAIFGREDDVVDVGSLFFEGDPTPIVELGKAPLTGPAEVEEIGLVSLGDRLRHAADLLQAASSETARNLLLFGLLIELRPAARRARLDRSGLAPFLEGVARSVAAGIAGRSPEEFATHLREAAEVLTRSAGFRDAVLLGDDLVPATESLARLAEGPGVVPIEQLAPDAEPPVPMADAGPPAPAAPDAFERSFTMLFELEQPVPAVVEVPEASAPASADSAGPESAPQAESFEVHPGQVVDVVAIESLLYRGRRALERADRVRIELSRALSEERPFAEIQPLVSELIDLVPLALEE